MPGPSLGTNLSSVVDWSTAFPFVDLFKMSRPWYTQRDGVWDTGDAEVLDLDGQGWIRGFTRDGSAASFQRVSTIVNTSGENLRDGTWVLDWNGEGRIEVWNATIISRTANQIILDPHNGAVEIQIHSTDPNGTGDYLRDIRFYHQTDAALIEAGAIFNPAFLDKIEDFRVLRFMDWMSTNNSQVRTWGEATPIGAAQQASFGDQSTGVSIDIMVALANEVGADPWFTIPHGADANYIRQFATYVRDHLDPGLQARFEYSNEVWNWGFQQAQWANQQASNTWGGVEGGWMQWYGLKAAEMANIVADVFGSQTGSRALNVFSTQADWKGLETYALNAAAHVAQGGEPPRDAPFHVYAIAPYFGGSIGRTDMTAQVNTWISMGEAGFQAALDYLSSSDAPDSISSLASTIAYHAQQAESLGWQLEGYEGGQHIVDLAGLFGGAENPARTRFFTALAARPEMGELYRDYLEMWRDNGGGLLAQYSDFGRASRYGSWGLWESVYSDDNPRSLAVEAFRDNEAVWWNDDRPAWVFEGRQGDGAPVDFIGTTGNDQINGTDRDDRLEGLGGSDLLRGTAGNDILLGGEGADRLEGGTGADRLQGGQGNDLYLVENAGDLVQDLGGGIDQVNSLISHSLYADIENLVLTGSAGSSGTGNALANRLTGNNGDNSLLGQAGHDTLRGEGGQDRLEGGKALDVLDGGAGNDTVWGNSGNDRLDGGLGDDRLYAGSGTDVLSGGAGKDRLFGGTDEAGDDFVYRAASESRTGSANRDTIHHFSRAADDLDLRAIDPRSSTSANEAFRYAGQSAAAYSVWWVDSGSDLMVRADVNGDRTADLEILLVSVGSLTVDNFLL